MSKNTQRETSHRHSGGEVESRSRTSRLNAHGNLPNASSLTKAEVASSSRRIRGFLSNALEQQRGGGKARFTRAIAAHRHVAGLSPPSYELQLKNDPRSRWTGQPDSSRKQSQPTSRHFDIFVTSDLYTRSKIQRRRFTYQLLGALKLYRPIFSHTYGPGSHDSILRRENYPELEDDDGRIPTA